MTIYNYFFQCQVKIDNIRSTTTSDGAMVNEWPLNEIYPNLPQ